MMKLTTPLLLLALLACYLPAQTAVAMNGTVSVTYDNGTMDTVDVAISGIEKPIKNANGQIIGGVFQGQLAVYGQTIQLRNTCKRLTVGESRHYYEELVVEGRRIRLSILLGHPQDPVFGSLDIADPLDPNNFGFGRGIL